MQWWFGFIDGKATPETIEIGCRNEHRRARFERASISGRVWKVYDRMCIWDDDIIKGGGVVACHNISPWEVYALARARIIPPPAEIEMRSGADTDRCLDQAIADLCEVSMPVRFNKRVARPGIRTRRNCVRSYASRAKTKPRRCL